MDPFAEKYYSISPYAYCSENPVNFAIKREQNDLAHFAEREQRKALRGLTLRLSEREWLAHFAEREQRKARRGLTLWIGMGVRSFYRFFHILHQR